RQRVVARGTWGLAISDDGGATWRWSCAAAMGIDPTREDPALLVAPDGAILLGAFHGVVRGDPEGCAFGVLPETEGEYIIDLATDPLERPYAILTSGIDPDRLLRSDDRGASFAQVGEPIADILLERVVPAPSDATRVYMSGAVPRGADGLRHGYFLRSIDGAASFVAIEIPLEGEERNVHVLAVDPTDPDRVFARMVRRITDAVPERLILSEDGGDTWRTVMTAHAISSVAITPDGATVYAGSSLNEGVFRSDTGGRSFALAQGEITIYCLEIHDGALWACVDELIDGLSVGRSTDGGASFETMLRLSEIRGMLPCSRCTPVGFVCPAWAPDVAFDLRL
ncbi:MAG: hypothetical protein K8H88_34430, partial [Sandaracinaceae bacterium]|nr:hypothetical protein [Sandaracinaceae bacterium]